MGSELPKVEGGSDTVLYPASVRAGSDLQDALTQSGFAVTRIHTYNTVRAGAWPRLPGARRHPRLPALPLPAGAGGGGGSPPAASPPLPPAPTPPSRRGLLVLSLAVQVGVTEVAPEVLRQAMAADIITFGSPSAVK